MSDLPTSWGSGRVGIDTETRDEDLTTLGPGVRRGAYIAGVSFAIEDGPGFYLPIRHGGGGNLDPQQVMRYLRDMSKTFTGTLCGANLGYDLDFLAEEQVEFGGVQWFRDVQVADPLINELHNSYSLESIAQRHGIPGKDETLLMEALAVYGYKGRSAKSGIWSLPSKHVGPYAEHDARLPLTLLRRQEREIEEQELWDVYNLESQVLPVLVKMRRRGVAVSVERLEKVEAWARAEQQKAIDAANNLITRRLDFSDITKTAVLAEVLKDLGVDLPKTATGKDSVTSAVLDGIDHPVGDHLRRAKKMSTLRTTFCDGVRHHLTNGRIHCTFNQLRRQKDDGSGDTEGAAFGRLSAANPNLQNQPARDPEIGPMWRSIYMPDEGGLWASLDYSQQEPRQAVHFAVEAGPRLIGEAAHRAALEAARRYREDPKTDFHDMMTRMVHGEDVLEREGEKQFKQLRKYCKNIYLGLSYGMGGAKLCRDLGLPTAWRLQWTEGRVRRFKDFETYEEAAAKAQAGRQAGYKVRMWEAAGADGQALMDKFDREVPFIRKMAQSCTERVEKVGFIKTLSGRRCRFPLLADGSYDWTHKAFNRLIQGSSADQTKMAVVALEAAGFPLQLQVHDEVDFTVASREVAEEAAQIMINVVPMHVPSRVDVEVGPSWGEAE
jgi:DNA polymerase I-like protein with 3'-5' exonuclease and polymerase domains